DPHAVERVPAEVATRYGMLPVRIEGEHLVMAMHDPLDLQALDDARFVSGLTVRPVVAPRDQIAKAINWHYRLSEALQDLTKKVELGADAELDGEMTEAELEKLRKRSEMAPIIRMVNGILVQGIQAGASDIHVEPQANEVLVRNRVDGVLVDSMRAPKWAQGVILSRLKIMADMDIAKHRVPQDGKIKVKMGERMIDLRVSALPAKHGEKVVVRILDKGATSLHLEHLGFGPEELLFIQDLLHSNQGLVLMCGPTGSGKTTTLYAMLNAIKGTHKNIITIEDPIEYEIEGINQVQVNKQAGLTFASTLRAVLRQDPNVILVGEIRDQETAEIALQAAMTGHLVLSTLHTIDSVGAIPRLLNLGVPPYLIASSLNAAMSQRLLRKNCPACRREYEPNEDIRRMIRSVRGEDMDFKCFRGAGCEQCGRTGYRGRTACYEMFGVTRELQALIQRGAGVHEIVMTVVKQMRRNMFQNAIDKARQGLTTLEEVLRVIPVEPGDEAKGQAALAPPSSGKPMADPWGAEAEVAGDAGVAGIPSRKALTASHETQTLCFSCGQPIRDERRPCPHCGFRPEDAEHTPLPSEPSRPMPQAPAHPAVPKNGPKEGGDLNGMTVLAVDDDERFLHALRAFLPKWGFHIETATNGREALERITQRVPHLVMTDVEMPEMDGLELVRNLRRNITTTLIPVIIFSVAGGLEDRLAGFTAGCDDYIPKPFSMQELHVRLKAVLRRAYHGLT
ncbi:MAG: response regulator, partial [Planctomycetes bacterium]|nr:response regulator [Planctomycetota bacterium]